MIVYKHIRNTNNLGDRWCSPYDHVPGLAEGAVAMDLDEPTPTGASAVIYGGGKIMGSLRAKLTPADLAAPVRVAWGVSTIQSFPVSPRYWRAFRAMTLVGSRDWGDTRFTFAPCASCASSVFDEDLSETDDVVAYLHHWRAPEMGIRVPPEIPVMDNTCPSFEEAIRFIARGKTVVSNSYHGVYWALLLGKRVLCIPFSNKFKKFRIAPGYTTAATWQRDLGRARGSDETLGLCRAATDSFAARVRDLAAHKTLAAPA
jgi:hypothetical protein